jgi:hypothetical protein
LSGGESGTTTTTTIDRFPAANGLALHRSLGAADVRSGGPNIPNFVVFAPLPLEVFVRDP